MEQVASFLIACALCLLVHRLLTVRARAAARRQLDALGQATAAGQPFSCDVRAYLCTARPGSRIRRYASGVVRVRPRSVCWERRSRRHPLTIDLSTAVITSESRPLPRGLLGLMDSDYVARHQLTVRRGDETIELLVRRPLAAVVRAGLEQAA